MCIVQVKKKRHFRVDEAWGRCYLAPH